MDDFDLQLTIEDHEKIKNMPPDQAAKYISDVVVNRQRKAERAREDAEDIARLGLDDLEGMLTSLKPSDPRFRQVRAAHAAIVSKAPAAQADPHQAEKDAKRAELTTQLNQLMQSPSANMQSIRRLSKQLREV